MTIADRIAAIQERVNTAAVNCQREINAIQILAVSKGQLPVVIEEAFAAGLTHFGESYLQEAQSKMRRLASLPLNWHFIGTIQSNKAEAIASHFCWVHSLSSEKVARKLNEYRPKRLPRLNVCLQVNLDNESTKSGLHINELVQLIPHIQALPFLHLRGLMAIPQLQSNEALQIASFTRLTTLLHYLNGRLDLHMDTLSMGMSQDFVAAICAGSTIIRIGQAIFDN